MVTSNEDHSDQTFRAYTSSQVEEYAKRRGGYPQRLIDEIIKHHASTGGAFGTVLDVGCGPGSATRDLAGHFHRAFGIDPGAEMIRTASTLGGHAKNGPIQFLEGSAEELVDIPDVSVDLISAATCAHWFDMEEFWPAASRVLTPGGTVAIFTIWRVWFHPGLGSRAEVAHRVLSDLEQGTLGPYQTPANWSLMNLYEDMKMPWSIANPCTAFPKSLSRRRVWNSRGQPEQDGSYVCGERVLTLDEAEKSVGTISAVTRWRNANPQFAGTEKDCVRAAFQEIGAILDCHPEDKITMVGPSVLITLKKVS